GAMMDHTETVGIAIMGGAQNYRVVALLASDRHPARAGDDGGAEEIARPRRRMDAAGGDIVEGHGGMRRGAARNLPPAVAAGGGQAAIDHDAVLAAGEFEGQAAGMSLVAERQRRRRAGID